MRFFADLAAVLIHPRTTMARILDATPRSAHVWLLFVLTALSGIVGDLDAPALSQVIEHSGGMKFTVMLAAILAGLIVVMPVLTWFYAYVPFFAGRFLGGTGDIRGVRAGLAWGFAPAVWALLYRIPAAIWLSPSAATSFRMGKNNIAIDPGRMADGCGIALIFGFLEFAVFVWCVFVMSNTVAEAHRFSAWRGFGAIVISAIVPLVVTLAAVLSLM